MKKLFLVLCVVIMFFGIVGCPSSDDPATTSSFTSTPVASSGTVTATEPVGTSVPEPSTLMLLGSGLIGLAVVGRKKIFK